MNTVKVMFAINTLDYCTSINGTEESVRSYFVGQWIDMGVYPTENMQQCIDIQFIKGASN